jgi:hypothetical protein
MECFLLFPPIKLILRTLMKIARDKATALVILPRWRGQVWSNLQKRLTVEEVRLGKSEKILQVGARMDLDHLKLPPGEHIAIKMTGIGMENH